MARSRTFADGEILTPADVNDHLVNHVPTAGDVYDTGWVTLLSGSASVVARRTGMTVTIRVDISGWVDTGSNDVVNINGGGVVLPADMRPAAEMYGSGIGANPGVSIQVLGLSVRPGGSLAVTKPRDVTAGIVASATYIVG